MLIEIWSDVACPWCYIGKRRLEKAVEGFAHRDDVEVSYRSYQLDPGAPAHPTETVATMLGRKYGGGAAAGTQMIDRVEATAAEEGLLFRHHDSLHANTGDAHRLLHLARSEGADGAQVELKERLLRAYFVEAANVADPDVLVGAATAVGLPEDRVREVLASDEFADAVDADIREAAGLGANGVPFYVVDRKFGISGAQPTEVFAQVLERAWTEAHPVLEQLGRVGTPGTVGGEDVCGPDGCAI
jgi:predicted DsbA family dithiol-disulfide isomerase